MSEKYSYISEPEQLFVIPEDMPYDRPNFEVVCRLLERIGGVAEILSAAHACDRNEIMPESVQNSAETIRDLALQANQAVNHIWKGVDKL